MQFKDLGLTDSLLRAVEAVGYESPTPIQAKAIPLALAGHDVIGRAQTGTGKTAAFALPILDRLERSEPVGRGRPAKPQRPAPPRRSRGRRRGRRSTGTTGPSKPIRSLIITPTRELAQQIEQAFEEYARFNNVSTLVIYGGVRYDKQLRRLDRGVDVVIATPGRLIDHMGRGTIDLSCVEVFVLDEVDRMFDMGFIKDVREIVSALPEGRQTLLFSATIPDQVKRLAQRVQRDPDLVEVGEQRSPIDTITQHVYPTSRDRKFELLKTIIAEEDMEMVLVFSGTKDGADFITRRLQHYGFDAMQLHSNLSQRERRDALAGFKAGEHRILVATDIAARGIDIEGISHVINYDVPRYAEDYIHRIGRTGRAEATGDAITFVGYEEEEFLSRIEEFVGTKFERKQYPNFDHGVVKLEKAKNAVSRRGRRGKRRYV